jgi:hypothetical protein
VDNPQSSLIIAIVVIAVAALAMLFGIWWLWWRLLGMDLQTKISWATGVRTWGLAIAAILGIISFASTWAQKRLAD